MRGGNRIKPYPCEECGAKRASRHRLCSRCREQVTCRVCRGSKPRGQQYCEPCLRALATTAYNRAERCEADQIGRAERVAELERRAAAGLDLWTGEPNA